MKKILVLTLMLSFGKVFGQTEADLWDIFALNSDTALACTNNGALYRTVNGGETWVIHENLLDIGRTICNIYFVDDKIGWMITRSGGIVFKTIDSGSTWEIHNITHGYPINFYDIAFLDSLRGWICGAEKNDESMMNTFFRAIFWTTIDGGETWNYHDGYRLDLSSYWRSVLFAGDNIGWMSCRYDDHWGTIFRSIDEGLTWQEQDIPKVLSIEKIFFLNDINGWAVGNKYTTKNGVSYWVTQLLQTVDGGETWVIQTEDFERPINDIHFLNDSSGIAIHRFQPDSRSPYPAHILKTSDGGDNWEIHSSYSDRLGGMHFVDEHTGWIVGEDELILKTTDGGMHWERQDNFSVLSNIDNHKLPENLDLLQNYPNPFNSSTTIKYSISKPSLVNLKIYDLIGNEVETLVDQQKRSGKHRLSFNGDRISSGLYFYTLIIDDKYSITKKMLLIR
jgi:photosystem II stability/assembly factor-like uncharacterized protein